jgi:hypothetical protein
MSKKSNLKIAPEKKATKYESAPKQGEIEIGRERADHIIKQRTFEYFDKPTLGEEFFIFKQIGDETSGQIIGHAITNIRRNSSYPLKLNDGRVIEFFANKQLHGIIRDFELVRSHVRIVYIGRNYQSWGGHAAKVYRVYKIDPATGSESGPLVQHLKSFKARKRGMIRQKGVL